MSFKDVAVFLTYQTSRDYPNRTRRDAKLQASLYNTISSLCILVPIVSTIFGIIILIKAELERRKGSLTNPVPKAILIPFCILSAGLLLLPLMIIGTLIHIKESGRELPSKKIKVIPPDYLL